MQDMGLDATGPPNGSSVAQAPAGDQPMAEAAADEVHERPAGPGIVVAMPVEEATAVTEETPDHPVDETPGLQEHSLALEEIDKTETQPAKGRPLKRRHVVQTICALVLILALAGSVWVYYLLALPHGNRPSSAETESIQPALATVSRSAASATAPELS